jgi:hypothetical protein
MVKGPQAMVIAGMGKARGALEHKPERLQRDEGIVTREELEKFPLLFIHGDSLHSANGDAIFNENAMKPSRGIFFCIKRQIMVNDTKGGTAPGRSRL